MKTTSGKIYVAIYKSDNKFRKKLDDGKIYDALISADCIICYYIAPFNLIKLVLLFNDLLICSFLKSAAAKRNLLGYHYLYKNKQEIF